jgi:hypothetical protein
MEFSHHYTFECLCVRVDPKIDDTQGNLARSVRTREISIGPSKKTKKNKERPEPRIERGTSRIYAKGEPLEISLRSDWKDGAKLFWDGLLWSTKLESYH